MSVISKNNAVIAFVASVLLIIAMPVAASWPTQEQWIPAIDINWSYITDPLKDVTPTGYLDLVTDLTSASLAAPFWNFDGTEVHFRMILDGDPIRNRGLSTARMLPYCWSVLVESTSDSYPDWAVVVDGTEDKDKFHTMYNLGLDSIMDGKTGNTVTMTQAPYVDSDGNQVLLNGYVRSKKITTDTSKWHNGNPDFYLDFSIPLSWLSRIGYSVPAPVTGTTPIKFAFGTSTVAPSINKDLAGQSGTMVIADYYNSVPPTALDSGSSYGTLLDTRHTSTPAAMGIWSQGETVTVSGYGWPKSGTYYTGYLNVRILDPSSAVAWQGTVVNSINGTVTNASTIPLLSSAPLGVYTILVADPRNIASYLIKDTFTVSASVFSTSTKTVNKATAGMLEELTYTIAVRNTGNQQALNTVVTDMPPGGITYVPGSTLLNGSPVADNAGSSRLFSGVSLGTVSAGSTNTFVFRATVNPTAPDQTVLVNSASISWTGGSISRSASTTVVAPRITITKSVSLSSALPGQVLTYTTYVTNTGHMNATSLEVFDTIPWQTDYVVGSATRGSGIGLTFLHVTGGAYDSSEVLPIVGLKWTVPSLGIGGSTTLEFRVQVR